MRLALAILCVLAIAPAAKGGDVEGERWPGPTVRVWNTTQYKQPVRDAMRAWNAAGARIRLVAAASASRADVVIRYGRIREQGTSTVGYAPNGSTTSLARGLGRIAATALATHELGHVLGLGHESRRCSVMAPVIRAGELRCAIATCRELWRCIVKADDLAGVRALYGRRPGT